MSKVWTEYLAQQLLVEAVDGTPASGPLPAAKLHLFMGSPALGPSMVPADFTGVGVLPTYTGYAAKDLTWGATPVRLPDGSFAARGTIAAPFQPTDAVTANTIAGAVVMDTGGTHVLYAYFFDQPREMVDAFSVIGIVELLGIKDSGADSDVDS